MAMEVKGKVIGWVVIDREGTPWPSSFTSAPAPAFHRDWKKSLRAAYGHLGPFRVAAVVIPRAKSAKKVKP